LVRACLSHAVDVVGHIPQQIEPTLHVVLEDGHNNGEDALRSYKWVQDRMGDPRRSLAGLTFSNKKDCLPLAAADHFAYTAWGEKSGQRPIGMPKKTLKSEASYRGNAFWIDLEQIPVMFKHSRRDAGSSCILVA
jgi:hypothetical protein